MAVPRTAAPLMRASTRRSGTTTRRRHLGSAGLGQDTESVGATVALVCQAVTHIQARARVALRCEERERGEGRHHRLSTFTCFLNRDPDWATAARL